KGSAETAALLGRLHLAEFEAAHASEQAARRILNAKLAQGVAPIVEGDDVFHLRANILDSGDFGKEGREFPNALFQVMHARKSLGFLVEEIREMMNDHRSAG